MGVANVRTTLYVASDVLDEARNAAVYLAGHPAHLTLPDWWTMLCSASSNGSATKTGGQPFPARAAELKGGRPIAA